MRSISMFFLIGVAAATLATNPALAGEENRLHAKHWFDLEGTSDPQISPDGQQIVYVRGSRDIMKDTSHSSLWIVSSDGSDHRPLNTGRHRESSPRWSPDGTRLAFVSDRDGRSQIFVRFMDTGQLVQVTNTVKSPSNLAWSPDGESIAFSMSVPTEAPAGVKMPFKPQGAEWADPPVVIDRLMYRFNRRGYLKHEFVHIFVVPSLGGTPRQLTSGDYNHGAPAWSRNGSCLYFSAVRKPEADWIVQDSEIYAVTLDGVIELLTAHKGPDDGPVVSPDGRRIAYTGFDEKNFAYTITRLYVMDSDGGNQRVLTAGLDRSVRRPRWAPDGRKIYVTVASEGTRHLYAVDLETGNAHPMTRGTMILQGFSVAQNGCLTAVMSTPDLPGDIVTFNAQNPEPKRLTRVNDDLLGFRELGAIEEVWYTSSFDDRRVQGWIIKPPGFDPSKNPSKKYPLVLYIHGGPHAMYDVRFNFEFQTHVARDQVLFYCNPRGSTGYGEEFGNIIQYAYPGDDYFDLISGVDEVISRGYIDERNLYVTGGSGGGVLTCWVIGRTDRFAAAVSQYPVINWYSFLLTCDINAFVNMRWFRNPPWEDPQRYMRRSPISLVGNVTTPCLLITGTEDWRTPISETEQYYTALKLQKKETRMIRVPDEAHGVRGRPSHYVAKILHIQEWFDNHRRGGENEKPEEAAGGGDDDEEGMR